MKKKIMIATLAVMAVLFVSCSKDKEDSTTTTTATTPFELRMTDATATYDEVNIDIQAVEIKTDGGATILLNVETGVYNLLDYANGNDTLIAIGTLPTSNVSQVRLILGNNNTVVVSGVTYPLSTPSAQQSGLKLNVHAVLQPGITYRMLIDFDANRSIVITGNGEYQLKPVIRVVATATNGSIHGLVSPMHVLPASARAIMGVDTFATTTDTLGNFLFLGIAPGTYTVIIDPQLPYVADTISNVNVTPGALTELGTIAF